MGINVAYSSSNAYAICTGVSLYSLLENNKMVPDISVYLFSTDISDENRNIISSIASSYGRQLTFIDINNQMDAIAEQFNLKAMRGGYNTFVRLFASNWLTGIDRILFVDSDTLVVGAIDELFATPMDGCLIAAVPEVGVYGRFSYGDDPDIIKTCRKYFNAGVMLINLALWRQENTSAYIAGKIPTYGKEWSSAEQSIFNYTINDRCRYVHLKNNFYSMFHFNSYAALRKCFLVDEIIPEEEYREAQDKPVIIHFIGLPYMRPWYRNNVSPYHALYQKYYGQTPWSAIPLLKIPKNPQFGFRVFDGILHCLLKYKLYRLYGFVNNFSQGKFKDVFRVLVGHRR